MTAPLYLLYRGAPSSCNYACGYCPFAKRVSSRHELDTDRRSLSRFASWVREQERNLQVFFTPWGEALIRRHYRDAMIRMSHQHHVTRVVAQTNLSCNVAWLADARLERVALWVTYHPTQVDFSQFLTKCRELDALGVRYSVGAVGTNENRPWIQRLRNALPPSVYLWVNAHKSHGSGYHDEAAVAELSRVDPHFPYNLQHHASRGQACGAGNTSLSVDAQGDARRCHFVPQKIGNIYADPLENILACRPCPNETCDCHIGYVHLERLRLHTVFAGGILERIPSNWGEA